MAARNGDRHALLQARRLAGAFGRTHDIEEGKDVVEAIMALVEGSAIFTVEGSSGGRRQPTPAREVVVEPSCHVIAVPKPNEMIRPSTSRLV